MHSHSTQNNKIYITHSLDIIECLRYLILYNVISLYILAQCQYTKTFIARFMLSLLIYLVVVFSELVNDKSRMEYLDYFRSIEIY